MTTVREIVFSKAAIEKLIGLNLKASTAFKLARIVREVNQTLGDFEKERIRLANKYGEAEGDNIVLKPECMDDFQAEIDELLNLNLDMNDKIGIDELGDVSLSAADILMLEWLIKSDGD